MTKPVVIEARGRRVETLARDIKRLSEQGDDVVLSIGDAVSPERIVKILQAATKGYEIALVVRHAELREYFENSIAGTAIGAGAAATAIVATIVAGNPVTLGAALAAIGLGALLGGVIGAGATPVAQVIVYKFKGETRLKFSAAA